MDYLSLTFFFLLIANSSCAQDYQSKSDLEKEIVGTWHYEIEPKSKITFSDDGIVKRYFEDKLQYTSRYEITDNCEGEKLQDRHFFLKENDDKGSSYCLYIQAINYNNNGFFTLMTISQGKIIVLKRNKS